MEFYRKYIITEVLKRDIGPKKLVMINGVTLDTTPSIFELEPRCSLGEEGLQIGDIIDIDIDSSGIYYKKQYKDCESAIVMGRHERTLYAFCAKYGNIQIQQDKYSTNPVITCAQRGDEILVKKISDDNFEILTNKTVDKLRSDFLQKQK